MPRFVILQHENSSVQPAVHWDFMLEQAGTLRTWALAEGPAIGREISADALPDHRLAYLDYEGPISQNRGSVTQWDAGQYELLIDSAQEVSVKLQGSRLTGTARLVPANHQNQRWIFCFSA